MQAPAWVTLGLFLGLLALVGIAWGCVVRLEMDAMEEAMAVRGKEIEGRLDRMIQRLTREEFSSEGGSLDGLSARLVRSTRDNPSILDLVVVDADRRVVHTLHPKGAGVPCLRQLPLRQAMDHEHAPGKLDDEAVACKSLPILVDGETRGLVFYHAKRDWHADGARLEAWVRRAAIRLGSVFLAFYVLLGALLVFALRARDRWRTRAASAQRVETLGALADGINHEIKNPLNAVGLSLQLLARKHADDAETKEVVAAATREADRIRSTLDQFGRYTRAARLDTEQVELGDWLRERFGDRGVAIHGGAAARIDLVQMEGAFAAIVGLLAQQGASELTVGARGGRWRFVAQVDAPDLDATDLRRLFDPYVRTEPHDVWRGLGLARAVFHAHGGTLEANLKSRRLVLAGQAPAHPPEMVR